MVAQRTSSDKSGDSWHHQIPKNLRSVYWKVHWDKLPLKAALILSEGSDNAEIPDLYAVAHHMAKLPGAHRNTVMEALKLWCVGRKHLENNIEAAVRTAFKNVFGPTGVPPVTVLPGLTSNDAKILEALSSLQPKPGAEFSASYTQLADISGVPRRSVIRSVKRMAEELFLIEMAQPEAHQKQEACVYRIPGQS